MLIGLTGRARAGKDTAADILCKELRADKISFAEPIKLGLSVMLGLGMEEFNDELKEKPISRFGNKSPRYMLQTLGTEWGRELIDKNLWTSLGMRRAKDRLVSRPRVNAVVLTDVRFDTEAIAIKKANGAIIEITRPIETGVLEHSSENGVSRQYIDASICNDGTIEDLKRNLLAIAHDSAWWR